MEKVIVVIPVYKLDLDEFEKISLHQVKQILKHYPMAFVAPESLEFDYGENYKKLSVERFRDDYFKSTLTYSKLMLSEEFYLRFNKYEYVLVYQLDAFVFSDRLKEFCELGFDYIGAPVLRSGISGWSDFRCRVGNGGFSLRKVSGAIAAIGYKDDIQKKYSACSEVSTVEDLFFSVCAKESDIPFISAPLSIAKTFSIEHDVGHCYKDLKNNLPFGCHAWMKMNYIVWKPIIESFGYNLPLMASEEKSGRELRVKIIGEYLMNRLTRKSCRIHIKNFFKEILPGAEYTVWGLGLEGKKCVDFLTSLGVNITCIYDRKADKRGLTYNGIPVRIPTRIQCDQEKKIIIASTKYEKEMLDVLNDIINDNSKIIIFRRMKEEIFKKYFFEIWS